MKGRDKVIDLETGKRQPLTAPQRTAIELRKDPDLCFFPKHPFYE